MSHLILTGAPGAGKTVLIRALAAAGHSVVAEAATDVIARAQAAGVDAPWEHPSFVQDIADLQLARLAQAAGPVVFHDRSPVCTIALARWLGFAEPAIAPEALAAFDRRVLFVEPLGFIETTAARRIGYEEALAFGALHRQVYEELGFGLVDIPPGSVAERLAAVTAAAGIG